MSSPRGQCYGLLSGMIEHERAERSTRRSPPWPSKRSLALTSPNTCFKSGRCLTGVDTRSQGLSEFVSIDKESNHEIVHALRLGAAQRTTDEPLDPGPEIDVFTLDFLRVLLAYLMLLHIEMPLVGPPAVSVKFCD